MGTEADYSDEWVELYNKSDYNISLASLSLESLNKTPIINLEGHIPAKGYFLLERTDDQTITNIPADQIYTGALENIGEILYLKDNKNNIIDKVDCNDGWYAGQNTKEGEKWTRRTMERINPDEIGANFENWQTYLLDSNENSNAIDVGGNLILGTPKAKNSINNENNSENNQEDGSNIYTTYTLVNKNIIEDTIWTLKNSPYLIYDNMGKSYELLEIAKGVTLTIEAGVIVKFYNPGLKVLGSIKAEGTEERPIIFTNYNDDKYGGDIFEGKDDSQFCQQNPDDKSKCPQAGDWSGIWFTNSSVNSALDSVIVRYAGSRARPFRAGSIYSGVAVGAAIKVEDASITLNNSIIEHNLFKGLWLINSLNTIVENSTFQNHIKYDYLSQNNFDWNKNIAIYLDASTPQIRNSIFQNNLTGIYIANNSQPIIENNNFSNNSFPIFIQNSYPQFSGNQMSDNRWNGIAFGQLKLNQDYVLKSDVVFINYEKYPSNSINVPIGYTLTIEPGTIIKSVYNTSGLKIEGTLIAEGTIEKPIVFTSLCDDEYGGDTDNGYCEMIDKKLEAGSWGQIIFTSTSLNSSLEHIIVRYGGTKWEQCNNHRPNYVLDINGSDLVLNDSLIENNTSGFYMENSNSQISNTIFQNHQYIGPPFSSFTSTGIYLRSSILTINTSSLFNNVLGVYIDTESQLNLTDLSFSDNDKDAEDLSLPANSSTGGADEIGPGLESGAESGVKIVEIFYDGVGEEEADEYVEIKNNGDAIQNLENWTLSDEANHIYIFIPYDLEPNESIKVYTNMGDFSYGSGTAIWNNDGDRALLKDNDNNIIDSFSY